MCDFVKQSLLNELTDYKLPFHLFDTSSYWQLEYTYIFLQGISNGNVQHSR